MFPLFAAGVVDTSGNFASASLAQVANRPPVSLTLVANLLPVSTTIAKLVGKFAAGVVVPVVHLDLRISPRIFKKFYMVLMEFSGAGEKLIHEKNQKQKVS